MTNQQILDKAKNDSIFYAEHIMGIELCDYQKEMIKNFNKKDYIVDRVRWSGITYIKSIMKIHKLLFTKEN